jgi:5'-nucleotidase
MSAALAPLAVAAALAVGLPAAACPGNVMLGATDSGVADRRADGGRCINDLIDDRANVWGSHGQFVQHVARVTEGLLRGRSLSGAERSRIVSAAARSDVGRSLQVRVLSISDFHGALLGPITPNVDGRAVGGAEHVAGHVRQLRAATPHHLFVSTGDMVGASQLVSSLFFDEPTVEVMNAMGLQINAIGNHELNRGQHEALRLQHGGCHPTAGCTDGTGFAGATYTSLAANIIVTATGRTFFPPYRVFDFAGHRVGVVGTILETTPSVVTPSGIVGLEFRNEADTTNALIPELRRQGVRTVVAAIHAGGRENPSTAPFDDCSNLEGRIVELVARLDDEVDLVLSADTHVPYICQLPNAVGRLVPVTNASHNGRFVTVADITLDTRSGGVIAVAARNQPTFHGDAPPDLAVRAIVERYASLSAPLRDRVIGQHAADLTRTANPAGESFLGNFIADAQYFATRGADAGGAVAAFMNPGGIRTDLPLRASGAEGDGRITFGEAFTVQPFSNDLVTMTLTGRQIEVLLEQQFTGCTAANAPADFNYPAGFTGQPFNRILQVSQAVAYTWNPAGPACDRVDPATIRIGGVPVSPTASYRITVNNFLADGGDNFRVLPLGTDRLTGVVDLVAFEAHLQRVGVVDPATYPLAQARIQRAP